MEVLVATLRLRSNRRRRGRKSPGGSGRERRGPAAVDQRCEPTLWGATVGQRLGPNGRLGGREASGPRNLRAVSRGRDGRQSIHTPCSLFLPCSPPEHLVGLTNRLFAAQPNDSHTGPNGASDRYRSCQQFSMVEPIPAVRATVLGIIRAQGSCPPVTAVIRLSRDGRGRDTKPANEASKPLPLGRWCRSLT